MRRGEVIHIGGGRFHRVDEAALAVHPVALGFRDAVVDLPLRGPATTSQSAIACPCRSGTSQDPFHASHSSWSLVPR